MNKVVVLLSTYNGSDYLEQFLNSVLNQKDVQVEIQVRDDGSTDGTKTILKRYENNYENIHVEFGKNKGWRVSFFDLMFSVKPQKDTYYAFADQDDVWLENKLITAVKMLSNYKNIPAIYHSNLTVTDKHLKKIGTFYSENQMPTSKLPENFFDGIGVGATMVFNQRSMNLIQKYRPQKTLTHDAYVMELVNLFGKSIYDSNSKYILYRRSADNVTGYGSDKVTVKPSLIQRYKKYKKAPKNGFSERAAEILNGYKHFLNEKDMKVLLQIAGYQSKKRYKYNLLLNPNMKASSLRKTLQMKFRVLANTL